MTNFLLEYLPILIFIFIGLGIAIGMTALSFVIGEEILIVKNYLLMNVVLKHLMMLEEDLMLDFILVAILFIIFDLRSSLSFSMGYITWKYWYIWFLVNDDFFINSYYWIYL